MTRSTPAEADNMVVFPNCKINLGLHILRKRMDGFHDLETIFYPLPLCDALEIVHADELSFTVSGIDVPGNTDDNLCLKAYHLLKKDFPTLPPVHIHLHKHIPIGAGLGGGSSDAAFTLLLLNDKFKLGISEPQLIAYAAILGSDCAFFIKNKPCLATGRGEVLEEIDLDLNRYSFLVVHPGIHVNTGKAFGKITPGEPAQQLRDLDLQSVHQWKDVLVNDFEAVVFAEHPAIKAIKDKMYTSGAVYAAMSGSGSAVVGLFPKGQLPVIDWGAQYKVFEKQ
ncbi:4-(cytidine 5'-diphospho)-2-C-methyl-D-erythritol kinase [Chitinophaga horti]|uniref:4-diphosphocytidyl-2-C-methyl-D-erythritol kinase n=1 Tax=Chitinophaga horti TaxID=2920382 RepID=A0ABY6J6E3_9BACT|nr:4-(cytidine 5'-diphospho)-2-C-methyl-D-erythritol kinase [Chitinophaga horti]UYQ95187.1 4-(cytidine 5'-diphospho)-2-C-methyl-D-erythritol kinase [Chitinophaga horti]